MEEEEEAAAEEEEVVAVEGCSNNYKAECTCQQCPRNHKKKKENTKKCIHPYLA